MKIGLSSFFMIVILAISEFATLTPLCVAADTMKMEQGKFAALKSFAEKRLRETKVPGAGVGIIKDGKVIFAGGFGTRDLNTGEHVNSQTAYLIGSSTKPFTSTAIAMLAQDGLVDWDKPVRTYLPTFGFKDEYVSARVTLRDLASHRTGVEAEPDWWGSKLSRGELVESMRDFPLNEGFRAKFQYNNAGFMAMGHVASVVTKGKYEDVVMQRIIKPLGMQNTIWSDLSGPDPPYKENVAYPHEIRSGRARRVDFEFEGEAIRPSGTLTSNIDDMLKWLQFNLQKGEYNGKRLLSEENYEELITPNMIAYYEDGLSREKKPAWQELYGLGWWLGDYNGHRGVHHGGSSIGTLSQVFFMPDKNFGVVTFVNAEEFLSDELVLFVIDLYKDELKEE
jgi:CubicO group peptidase (beta-lactamase class C family)